MKKAFLANLIIILSLICGCGAFGNELTERSSFAFDTFITISDEGHSDTYYNNLFVTIGMLEDKLSVTKADSEISRLNREKELTPSKEVYEIIEKAVEASKLTGGAFDITSCPYVETWGFTTKEYRVPKEEELEAISKKVGFENIELSDGKVILKNDATIDLGGIAKGYLGDMLADIKGDETAIISLGGNIRVIGRKKDGSLWKIGIADPKSPSEIMGYLQVEDTNIVTSGGYERFFYGNDGEMYWHIIDPASGKPAKNGIISVTVIGKDGTMCDALSTGLFVMGEEKVKEFYQNNSDYELVIVTEDDRILLSEGIEEFFVSGGNTKRQVEVITKNK